MKRKTSVIILTAILVLLVFAVFAMPVSAQSVTLDYPTDDTIISSVSYLNATVAGFTDFNGNVTFYYSLDNSTWTFICNSTTGGGPFSETWDTTQVPDDVYFLNVTALNASDLVAAYNFSANITVDNAKWVNITSPVNITVITNATSFKTVINLNATTHNATAFSKVQNATFWNSTDGVNWVEIGINDTSGNYTHFNLSKSITTWPNETYFIKVVTNDGLENVSENIIIDNALPTITVGSSAGTYTYLESTTISGTAYGTGSNITKITLDGVVFTGNLSADTADQRNRTYSKSFSLTIGSNTFTVIATDAAGNSKTETITVFRYTSAAPTYGSQLTVREVNQSTDAGGISTHIFDIKNIGSVQDTFMIEATSTGNVTLKLEETGVPTTADFASSAQLSMTLYEAQEKEFKLYSTSDEANTYSINVVATSQGDTTKKSSVLVNSEFISIAPTPTPTPTVTPTPTPTPAVTPTPTPYVYPTPTPTPYVYPTPTPVPTPSPPVPGFEAVFAILTIAAVAYLVRRREE
ncbi:MAG: PGF-CTERM sorting domain-containing protein [Methanocellales archaeon]|nr:PGF-CTERM sorting domain-containing protein [Methanocellales archaeon]